ncbi:hypothetical protein [Mangrovimonas sp. TPBH4]|uniref:hypothetical protein n=1 Tax=Mangrovimonas sp. TPBH4 TaxID=1645914 RepID=UPI0006B42F99|nr:hypothetical protein [Mangrovimonas sp. TPBH4]
MKLLKHISLVGIAVGVLSSFTIAETNVYICKGKYSKKYHYNKSCRGLSNCSTDIYKVSLEEARDLQRTLCGWED